MFQRMAPGALAILAAGLWLGCPVEPPDETLEDPGHDWDGDGYCEQDPCMEGAQGGDCNDDDAAVHPGADEGCDGLDSDCDGVLGEDELDGDGDGLTSCDGDCDGARADVHPGAEDVCDDVPDNDCDGQPDPSEADADGDGVSVCDGDCDDDDGGTYPDADEVCNDWIDNDCDGTSNGCGLHGIVGLGSADMVYPGESPDDQAGVSLDACDLDADGFSDVLVGAWREGTGGNRAGAVYILYGSSAGTATLDAADAKLVGEDSQDSAGRSTACLGDVDGDGSEDILVGAHNNEGRGAVYVLDGSLYGEVDLSDAVAKLTGEASGDLAGFAAAAAGDVNGDGLDDLLVGAHHQDEGGDTAGAAYLVVGPMIGTASLATATAKLVGEEANDDAGRSVAAAGDINGDGYGDILVGAYQSDTGLPGRAYLVHGPIAGTVDLSAADAVLEGEAGDDGTGVSVFGPGDVDGDGNDDILVGAYHHDEGGSDAGVAYLLHGPVSGSVDLASASVLFFGEDDGDATGYVVRGGGDMDGNGLPDIIVGAREESSVAPGAGAVYLLYAAPAGDLSLADADAKLTGEDDGDNASYALELAGDVNGDGYDDLLVGAHEASGGGTAYLLYGGGM